MRIVVEIAECSVPSAGEGEKLESLRFTADGNYETYLFDSERNRVG